MSAIGFEELLAQTGRESLQTFLLGLKSPCFESELMRTAFPDFEILTASPLALYQHHFALFHLLYRTQDEFRQKGKYLHVHFMRTSVAEMPGAGQCRNYDDELGRFCGEVTPGGDTSCELHARIFGQNELFELSDRYFYLDSENYQALNEETAGAFLNGTWEVLAHQDKLQRAFRTLDLAPTSDLAAIRRRFTTLARECHPDIDSGSHQRFCELNNAYHLLLRLLAAFGGRSG